MKKTFAIVMLVMFLLNVLGLYGIFLGLKFSYSREVMRGFDEEKYSTADVKTFAIPWTVPYYTDPTDGYERVDGEFEHGGEMFRLVKQRLHRDTLYLVCVKDRVGQRINQEITDYVKTFTDKPINARQQNSKTLQFFCKDYLSTVVSVQSGHSGWDHVISPVHLVDHYSYQSPFEIFCPPRGIVTA